MHLLLNCRFSEGHLLLINRNKLCHVDNSNGHTDSHVLRAMLVFAITIATRQIDNIYIIHGWLYIITVFTFYPTEFFRRIFYCYLFEGVYFGPRRRPSRLVSTAYTVFNPLLQDIYT